MSQLHHSLLRHGGVWFQDAKIKIGGKNTGMRVEQYKNSNYKTKTQRSIYELLTSSKANLITSTQSSYCFSMAIWSAVEDAPFYYEKIESERLLRIWGRRRHRQDETGWRWGVQMDAVPWYKESQTWHRLDRELTAITNRNSRPSTLLILSNTIRSSSMLSDESPLRVDAAS